MSSIAFRYETSSGYVPILGDSALVSGPIASQDAGSSYASIYYQVGGGMLNGLFKTALQTAGQLDATNAALQAAYDARFGDGAWAQDRDPQKRKGDPPLTSFLVPLRPGVGPIGHHVVGLMYSVGPQLGGDKSLDATVYAQIYTDAMAEVARFRAAGQALDGLRITMLSSGAYAPSGGGGQAFFAQLAEAIIDGILAGVKAEASLADLMILVNSDGPGGKEQTAFDTAAMNRGLSPDAAGFDVPIS